MSNDNIEIGKIFKAIDNLEGKLNARQKEFIKSLQRYFHSTGKLTERQMAVLKDMILFLK